MPRPLRRDVSNIRQTALLEVIHSGETYRVALKRVIGARRFTLRVRSATRDVVLTMPVRGSVAAAHEFAGRNAAWIGARLKRLPRPIGFEPDAVIPVRGVNHLITHQPDSRGTAWIETSESIDALPLLCVAGDAPHVARRINDFLHREARRDLEAAVDRHVKTIGATARRVTVRDTTSRWGSCSATGALSFSWRLIMAPSYVLDYLAAHEVAHLVHLDHSPNFWKVTKRLAPFTDRAEAWLKMHGADLHRYGATED